MAAAKKPTLGAIVDKLRKKDLELTELAERKKQLDREYELLERQFLDLADEQETKSASGTLALATVTEVTFPHVEDWDALYAYMEENKYWHLLQKRPSVPGFRELFEAGTAVPGVLPHTKRKVSIRPV